MRVLLVGAGARESAMAWKFSTSPLLEQLWVWPGREATLMGRAAAPQGLGGDATWQDIALWSWHHKVDLVVSGPEAPLAAGAADIFLEQTQIPFFGPSKSLARLESSKSFSKEIMQEAGIPTAAFVVVSDKHECANVAQDFMRRFGKVVLKASGLASGKGVFVCLDPEQVKDAITRLYSPDMLESAREVVVEQCLEGRECSHFSLICRNHPTFLGFAVDYKRLHDGDNGPNTGGMGAYSPVPWLPADAELRIKELVMDPLMAAIARRGEFYTGYLYVGIMWTKAGPYVLEFNVRLGDPEAQILAVQDSRDWLAMIAEVVKKQGSELPAAGGGAAHDNAFGASAEPAADSYTVGIVGAAPSYPFGTGANYETVLPRELLSSHSTDLQVFGAAISPVGRDWRTGAGRVMTVVARANSMAAAREKAYAKIAEIKKAWPQVHFRSDVALGL